jgi:hypothetical protein
MLNSLRSAVALIATCALNACTPTPVELDVELPPVYATNTCLAGYRPGVMITFATTALPPDSIGFPVFYLSVPGNLIELPGRTFLPRGTSGTPFTFSLQYKASLSSRRVDEMRGTFRVVEIARDSSMIGAFDVHMEDGTHLQREFSAPWRPRPIRCAPPKSYGGA